MLPQDPFILLSYVNTQLRDSFPSLEELCAAEGIEVQALTHKLSAAGFTYDAGQRQFR